MSITVYLSPVGNGQVFLNSAGQPANAGLITTFLAGTSTMAATYTTSSGSVANGNPIMLTPAGMPPAEIWIPAGISMKFVTTDSLGNPIGPPLDNLYGIGDLSRGGSFYTVLSGATGDGITDDTAAFSKSAKAAPSATNPLGPGIATSGINLAPKTQIYVPPGTYNLASLVDTGGTEVTWILTDGANVPNYANLNGRVVRPGQRDNRAHYGIVDYACCDSVKANTDLDSGPQVMGFATASAIANYPTRDSVAFYAENNSPVPLATIVDAGTTYTSTTIVPGVALTAAQVLGLRRGMIINTKHVTIYSGFINSWASDGSSITVTAWYLSGGGAGTPANGTGAYVNPITKIWTHNANVTLTATGLATQAAGFELGCQNNLSAPAAIGASPLMYGYDCVNLGTYVADTAFIARHNGTGFFAGFQVNGTFNGGTTSYGFLNNTTYGNAVTTNGVGFISSPILAASTAITNIRHYQTSDTALGGGASITNQSGYYCTDLTTGTNNYGFHSAVSAGAGKFAFYGVGTAASLFGGPINLQGVAASVSAGVALGGSTQTTVGANGAASALTANPLGYLIAYLGATKIAIPYYNG